MLPSDFASGKAPYRDSYPASNESGARIVVEVEFDIYNDPFRMYAILDTGAPWCVVSFEVAADAGMEIDRNLNQTLLVRGKSIDGHLARGPIRLLAEQGDSIDIEATFFVLSEDYPSDTLPVFIGYQGLLERIRFAIDPVTNSVYFGA